jgi:predicted MFS family arabinose efflux permease
MPEDGSLVTVTSHSTPETEALPASEIDERPLPRLTGLAATFRSLRHRNYRLYFFGQLVSVTGTWMQMTALTWLAFDLTHKSIWPASISAAQIIPTFALGIWGGSLADYWPKRALIFITQSAFLLLALLLAGLTLSDVVTPWQLLVVAAANGLVQAVDLPARLAFVMDMAGREDLVNAVGLNSLLFNVARAFGPAMAGVLLYWVKPWACFLANALSYLAVLWALASMQIVSPPPPQIGKKARQSFVDVFRFLRRHPQLPFLILLAGSTSFFGWPFSNLLPALAHENLGSDENGYSLMLSGTGIGALAAAWMIATFGSVEHCRGHIMFGVVIVSASLVGLSRAGNLPLAIGCCAVAGFGLIQLLATTQSVVQLSTNEDNRGMIMGIWAMTLSGALPLGNLFAGPAADRWGVPQVLSVLGLSCGVAALGLLALFRLLKPSPES